MVVRDWEYQNSSVLSPHPDYPTLKKQRPQDSTYTVAHIPTKTKLCILPVDATAVFAVQSKSILPVTSSRAYKHFAHLNFLVGRPRLPGLQPSRRAALPPSHALRRSCLHYSILCDQDSDSGNFIDPQVSARSPRCKLREGLRGYAPPDLVHRKVSPSTCAA